MILRLQSGHNTLNIFLFLRLHNYRSKRHFQIVQTIFLQQESYRQHQDEDYMHTHKFFDRPKTAFCPCLGNSGKRNSILIEKIRFHFFSFLSRITEKRRGLSGVFR